MRKFILPLIAALMMMFQSCSVYTKVHFNKDYSGTYRTEIDMEELLMMAAMFDTTGTMDQADMMLELFDSLDSMGFTKQWDEMEGITNVYFEPIADKGIVVEYDFANIAVLNESINSLAESMDMENMMGDQPVNVSPTTPSDHESFRLDKKTLSYSSPESEGSPLGEMGELGDMGGGDMDLGEMFTMKMEFTFDRKIKKVEAENMTIEKQEKQRVSASVDMDKIMEGGSYGIVFKLK